METFRLNSVFIICILQINHSNKLKHECEHIPVYFGFTYTNQTHSVCALGFADLKHEWHTKKGLMPNFTQQ